MKHLFKQPLFYTTVLSLVALGLIIASYVFGWTTPTASPPAGNVVLSQGALPSGSAGYVQFASSSTAFGGDANLFWDNTNKRLGIGTTTPDSQLTIYRHDDDFPTIKLINNYSEAGGRIILGSISAPNLIKIVADSGGDPGIYFDYGGYGVISSDQGDLYIDAPNIILGSYFSGGNVGIGTTAPSQKLTVAGNIGLQAGANAFIGTLNNYALSLRTNNTDRIFITNTGNVGIGTTAPGAGLDINEGSTNNVALALRSSGTGWGSGVQFINSASGAKNYGLYAGSDGKWHFVDVSSSTDRMIIDSSGNVGIGTTAPAEKLHVVGNIQIGSLTNSGGAAIKQGVYPFDSYIAYTDDGTGYGPAWIHTNTGSGGTTQPTMFLQTQGNSAKLNINSDLGLGPMTVTLGSYPSITTNVFIGGDSGDNSYFNTGGNVGIGTTAPGYKLDVSGDVRLTGNLIATSNTLDNCAWTAWTCNASQTCPTGQVVAGVQRYTTGTLCGTAPTQWYQMSLYCCNL